MKSSGKIKRLLKNAEVEINPDVKKTALNQLINELRKSEIPASAEPGPIIWRIIMKNRITKIVTAAAFAVVIIGFSVFFSLSQQTLYAQVKNALQKARSIHVLMTEYRDGNWFKDHEIWYDCEKGIREEQRYEDQTDVRIDNKQYEWRYTVGDTIVAQFNSYRDADDWAKNLYEWLRVNHERVPSGDKFINGVFCKMFSLSMPNGRKLASIWVNKDNRILKLEYKGKEDEQIITGVGDIEYEKEIDNHLFSPEFNNNIEIVGPSELIKEKFPLETAIFKRESLGFVFAVHTLGFGEGFKYLVCSNRLTEQTRNEISEGNPWTYYGGFHLFGRYDEYGFYLDSSDFPIRLARMTHDGIQVEWYLLIPTGNQAKQTAGCDVDVRINTANQLEEKLDAEGLPIKEKFRLNIKPGETKEQVLALKDITSQIFSLGIELRPIVHSFNLTKVVTESDGNRVQAYKKPGIELSEEDYLKSCHDRLEYHLNQYNKQ